MSEQVTRNNQERKDQKNCGADDNRKNPSSPAEDGRKRQGLEEGDRNEDNRRNKIEAAETNIETRRQAEIDDSRKKQNLYSV